MKRWWGIRHLRWFYWNIRVINHVERCKKVGLGYWMSPSDVATLDAIWEGKD